MRGCGSAAPRLAQWCALASVTLRSRFEQFEGKGAGAAAEPKPDRIHASGSGVEMRGALRLRCSGARSMARWQALHCGADLDGS